MIVVRTEDPRIDPDVAALLREREAHSAANYPPESIHLLDLDRLGKPDVTFFTARVDGRLAGCGALWLGASGTAEVKSMFVRPAHRRAGLARLLLQAIVDEAMRREVSVLRLETGRDAHAARALYARAGFVEIEAFAPYRPDPHCVFMQRVLRQ